MRFSVCQGEQDGCYSPQLVEHLLSHCFGGTLLPRLISSQTWARAATSQESFPLHCSLLHDFGDCRESGPERQEGLCRQQGQHVPSVLQGVGSAPQRCVPAAYKSRASRDPVAPALPSWCLLVSSLVVETPHQPLAPLVSLKPRRESAPWGGGSRRCMSQLSAARDPVCSCPLGSLWGNLFWKSL